METLLPHPAHPPRHIRGVTARLLSYDAAWCLLRWRVEGARDLVVPAFAGRVRRDGLWRTTCFEMFVHPVTPTSAHPELVEGCAPTPTYGEFNFSPSEAWAAYDFTARRTGMTARACDRAPVITPRCGRDVLICDVAIPSGILPPPPWHYGLTAVIAENDGTLSFWASAHAGENPDFHDPACHTAWLAAPREP